MTIKIPDKVKQNFVFLFDDMSYKLIDKGESPSFGDYYVVVGSNELKFRFVSDRKEEFVDIAFPASENEWFDLNFVKVLIDKADVMLDSDFTELGNFIKENYIAIKELFSSENIAETRKKLRELGKKRAKRMFPQVER